MSANAKPVLKSHKTSHFSSGSLSNPPKHQPAFTAREVQPRPVPHTVWAHGGTVTVSGMCTMPEKMFIDLWMSGEFRGSMYKYI